MIRRLTILLILSSMLLHCASRIGFLSYLYQQRHEIATAAGLIRETPIAVCSSDYEPGHNLIIHTQESDQSVPPAFLQTREIQLFFQYTFTHQTHQSNLFQGIIGATPYRFTALAAIKPEIFQPPKIG